MTAVLFAALMHASWNAIIKSGSDTFLDTLLVGSGAALVAAATLPFLPLPAIESWPYLAISVILELAYYSLVAAAYRTGDLSYVYPIMRGSSCLTPAGHSRATYRNFFPATARWQMTGIRLAKDNSLP